MESQTLEVKWSNHDSNMIAGLQELYLSDTLLDVTIACGEFSLKAHKAVLSASSTFFRKLFLDNPCKHPILIMTDIDFGDLKTIVEFIYQGKIQIKQQKLSQFLKTADKLKIKGLSNFEDTNACEQLEIDLDFHSGSMWEHSATESTLENNIKVERIVHANSKSLTNDTQNDRDEEIQTIQVGHAPEHPESHSCNYWPSDNFNQTSSSSLFPNCSLPNPSVSNHPSLSSVSKPSTCISNHVSSSNSFSDNSLPPSSVSHRGSSSKILSDSNLLKPCVSYQAPSENVLPGYHLPNPSISPHHFAVPLISETITYSGSQTNDKKPKQPNIRTETNTETLDQSPITVASNSKSSFGAVESLGTESSTQNGNMGYTIVENDISATATIPMSGERLLHHQQTVSSAVPSEEHIHQNKVYKSFICKKEFLQRDVLQDFHVHSLEKTVFYNSRFINQRQLNTHIQADTGKKHYKCDVCLRNYSSVSSFKTHQIIHTGEKPYKCDFCHKCFRQKKTLNHHTSIHTGEKPFKCDVCGKCFARSTNLNVHKRTHERKIE